MNLSARTEYACTAVLELALRYETGQPIQVRRIAEMHEIPARFLVQILLQLKAAGLVTSTRGAAGGYRLAVPPEQLSLRDVIRVIEGTGDSPPEQRVAASPAVRVLHRRWREIEAAEQQMLAETSMAELVEQVQESEAPMYFI